MDELRLAKRSQPRAARARDFLETHLCKLIAEFLRTFERCFRSAHVSGTHVHEGSLLLLFDQARERFGQGCVLAARMLERGRRRDRPE